MPVWHEQTRAARQAGDLVVLGVIQEQHADRCRLFAQWKQFDWPILHDPVNRLGSRAVPIFVALDEGGIVVDQNLRVNELDDFLARPANQEIAATTAQPPRDVIAPWTESLTKGDRKLLWGKAAEISSVVDFYSRATELESTSAAAWFRLGVALRARFDSPHRQPEDFQAAVDAWGQALEIDPNHYIYRRRIQQFGPRLIKPYPFYDWVEQARREIKARGETPVTLVAEPVGAEIAAPAKTVKSGNQAIDPPDPKGRIDRDRGELIEAAVTVVPGKIKPGDAIRIHVRLSPRQTCHWNNEAEPLTLWLETPAGWKSETRLIEAAQPESPESREIRQLDFELQSAAKTKTESIKAYALYYICEERGGQCLYRRQDIEIPIRYQD